MDVFVQLMGHILINFTPSLALKVIIIINLACPNTTFAHQGLCVKCPANCQKCQYDAFYRSLL